MHPRSTFIGRNCGVHIATDITTREPHVCRRWIPAFAHVCTDCGSPDGTPIAIRERGARLVARMLDYFDLCAQGGDREATILRYKKPLALPPGPPPPKLLARPKPAPVVTVEPPAHPKPGDDAIRAAFLASGSYSGAAKLLGIVPTTARRAVLRLGLKSTQPSGNRTGRRRARTSAESSTQ